jgi:hypothetical protein
MVKRRQVGSGGENRGGAARRGGRDWEGRRGRAGRLEGGVYTIILYLHALPALHALASACMREFACACMRLHEREGSGGKNVEGRRRGWEGLGGVGSGWEGLGAE